MKIQFNKYSLDPATCKIGNIIQNVATDFDSKRRKIFNVIAKNIEIALHFGFGS